MALTIYPSRNLLPVRETLARPAGRRRTVDLSALNALLPRTVQLIIAWCGVILVLAGLPFAVGKIWTLIRKAAKLFAAIDNLVPVVLKMAAQFENNSGSTLKDKVDRIAAQMDERAGALENVKHIAESAKSTAETAIHTAEQVSKQLVWMLENLPDKTDRVLAAIHDSREAAAEIAERAASIAAKAVKEGDPRPVVISNSPDNPVKVHEVDGF